MKQLVIILLLSLAAAAQTTVTGTVTDPNGNPFANGTAAAQNAPASGQALVSVSPVSTTSAGFFSLTIPSAGNWIFTVCAPPTPLGPTQNPTPSQICFSSSPVSISGTTQDVSALLNQAAPVIGPLLNTAPSSPASLLVAPSALSFGTVQENVQSNPLIVTLSNTGSTAVTITSVTLAAAVGTPASDFATSNLNICTALIPAGANCSIAFTFKPTTLAAESATLTIVASGFVTNSTVTLSGTGSSSATFLLSVLGAGTGSGNCISSESPPLINASFVAGVLQPGSIGSANYASGASVTLSCSETDGGTFGGLSGAGCSGATCLLSITGTTTVTATFNAPSVTTAVVNITGSGNGAGTVTSNVGDSAGIISCLSTAGVVTPSGGSGCNATFPVGTSVTLTASVTGSNSFVAWTGVSGCASSLTCTFTVSGNVTVNTNFQSSTVPLSLVQTAAGMLSGSTITCTWAQAQNAGDTLIIAGGWGNITTTVSSIADTSLNTYTQVPTISPKVGNGRTQVLYYAQNIASATAGANVTTLTLSTTALGNARCLEYAGVIKSGSPIDVSAAATGTGNAPASGSAITTVANDLLTGFTDQSSTINTVSSGFKQQITSGGDDEEDQQGVVTGTYNFQPTLSGGASGISCTALAQNHSSAATNSFTTTSISPSSNNVVLIGVEATLASGNGPGAIQTVTGNGLTWSNIKSQAFSGVQGAGRARELDLWSAIGSAPTTGGVTFTYAGGVNPTGVTYTISQCSGVNTVTPIGISAANGTTTSTASPATVTMGAFGSASNGTYGVVAVQGGGRTLTAGTGMSVLGNDGSLVSQADEFGTANVSPVQETFSGATTNWAAIGAELVAGTGTANWDVAIVAWKAQQTSNGTGGSPLTITADGFGFGAVTSSVGNPPISCAADSRQAEGNCSTPVTAGSLVTLTATPAPGIPGSSFCCWVGITGCSVAPTCSFTMPSTAVTVRASFSPNNPVPPLINTQEFIADINYPTSFIAFALPADLATTAAEHYTGGDTLVQTALTGNGTTSASNYGQAQFTSSGINDFSVSAIYYAQGSDPEYCFPTGSVTNFFPKSGPDDPIGGCFHAPSGAQFGGNASGGTCTSCRVDQNIVIRDTKFDRMIAMYNNPNGSTISGNYFSLPPCSGICNLSNIGYASWASSRSTDQVWGNGPVETLGTAPMAMTVRELEMDNQTIPHALYINSFCTNPSQVVFPNIRSFNTAQNCVAQGASGGNTNRPNNGMLIWLDYTPSQLATICASVEQPQCTLITALATYGSYLGDTGGSVDTLHCCHTEGPQAYTFAGIADPMLAYLKGFCPGTNCTVLNPTSVPPKSSVINTLNTLAGIPNIGGTGVASHIHIADACVAKGLAGLTAANDAAGGASGVYDPAPCVGAVRIDMYGPGTITATSGGSSWAVNCDRAKLATPANINGCNTAGANGTTVTLTAAPNTGHSFVAWGPGTNCSGSTNPNCTLTLDGTVGLKQLTANFQ